LGVSRQHTFAVWLGAVMLHALLASYL